MIPCQKCGHDNPLGTLYCHGCGVKLHVSTTQVFGSIKQTQTEAADQKVFAHGKSAATIGGFVLVAGIIFQALIIPDAPPPRVPLVPSRPATAVFEARPPWRDARTTTEAEVTWPAPVGRQVDENLIEWRRQTAAGLLDSFGLDIGRLRVWQQAIVDRQDEHGGFPGKDRIAATALACVALQAYPGEPAIDQAAERGRAHLRKQFDFLRTGRGSDLAIALTMLALIESDGHEVIQPFASLLVNGKEPVWQCLALLRLQPEQRPTNLTALQRAAESDPLTAVLFDLLAGGRKIPTDGLADRATIADLDAIDRVAWSQWQWLQLGHLVTYADTIREWSRLPDPEPSPPDFSLLTGAHTDHALAVISCATPASIPVSWREQPEP